MARRTMTIKRIDPWSVLKVGFLANLVLLGILLLAGRVVWFFIERLELVTKACEVAESVGFQDCGLNGGNIFRNALLLGLLGVIVQTGIFVFAAFLFNLISELTGGLSLGVEDDLQSRAQAVSAQTRQPASRTTGRSVPTSEVVTASGRGVPAEAAAAGGGGVAAKVASVAKQAAGAAAGAASSAADAAKQAAAKAQAARAEAEARAKENARTAPEPSAPSGSSASGSSTPTQPRPAQPSQPAQPAPSAQPAQPVQPAQPAQSPSTPAQPRPVSQDPAPTQRQAPSEDLFGARNEPKPGPQGPFQP